MDNSGKNSSSEMGVETSESTSPSQLQGPEYPYDNPHVRYISNSEIQTFKDCRRKWWLAYYRGLTLRSEKQTGPLAIGRRIHRALEQWYVPDGKARTNPCDALERIITEDKTLLTNQFDGSIPFDLSEQFKKESNLERIMLEGYMQWLEETGADSDLIVVAPELYVEVKLQKFNRFDEKETRLIGRLDVQVERTTDKKLMFIDHKTVADMTSPVMMLPLDEQMLMYLFLQQQSSTDARKSAGAIYNMLKKVRRTGTAKPPFFNRVEVHHNRHQVESFYDQLRGVIRDITEVEEDLKHGAEHNSVVYPRPTRDCTWKCDFQMICSMFNDGSRVNAALDNLYTIQNPIKYYDKEMRESNQ